SHTLTAADWQSLAQESELRFVARYEDQPLDGLFRRFSVTVTADEPGLAPTGLRVEVDVASADMNDREINDELTQADWFYTERFPQAVFQSDRIVEDGKGMLLATGTLQLKGRRHETSVPFSWRVEGDRAELSGKTVLSRLSWNIGAGEWASDEPIADTVELEFRVVLQARD
ncbi:MAG: YceI family protein, partial [Xanthomonadales bacterium]|nr:YceI family protein [Xanthomonadales bacterium]